MSLEKSPNFSEKTEQVNARIKALNAEIVSLEAIKVKIKAEAAKKKEVEVIETTEEPSLILKDDKTLAKSKEPKAETTAKSPENKFQRVARLLENFKNSDDEFEKDDTFMLIHKEYENFLNNLAYKTVTRCDGYEPRYILEMARADLMHRFFYAVKNYKLGNNFTTYMQLVMQEYINGDWLWYIRKYSKIDQVTVYASSDEDDEDEGLNLKNIDFRHKFSVNSSKSPLKVEISAERIKEMKSKLKENRCPICEEEGCKDPGHRKKWRKILGSFERSTMMGKVKDQNYLWGQKGSTPEEECVKQETIRLVREELINNLDPESAKVLMMRYGMHDNNKYTLYQIAESMEWFQPDGTPNDKKVNRVLEKSLKTLRSSDILRKLLPA